jgi:hypothetical protein
MASLNKAAVQMQGAMQQMQQQGGQGGRFAAAAAPRHGDAAAADQYADGADRETRKG